MRSDSHPDPPRPGSPPEREASATLGAAVREQRRHLGLSQGEIAFAANVSPRTVYAIESGKETVRLDVLQRVIAAVGLELTVRHRDRVWRPGA